VTQPTRRRRAIACYAIGLLAACARSSLPASSPSPAQPPTGGADVFVAVSPATNRSGTLADFQPDVPAVDGPFECTGREPIGQSGIGRELLGPNAVSISAAFPNRATTRATVVVFVDSTGTPIRYAERRGPPIQSAVPAGLESSASAADVAAAAAAVRSTNITLDYGRGRGFIANRGGGRPDQSVSGPLDVVGSTDKFGKPLDRAARVLAQCQVRR
jgi:hypothetical protein